MEYPPGDGVLKEFVGFGWVLYEGQYLLRVFLRKADDGFTLNQARASV